MKDWISSQGSNTRNVTPITGLKKEETPNSESNCLSQTTSEAVRERTRYSTSILKWATIACFLGTMKPNYFQ